MQPLTVKQIEEIKKLAEELPPLDEEFNEINILAGLFEELDWLKHCILVLNRDLEELRGFVGFEPS